jgi:hypothetical protein
MRRTPADAPARSVVFYKCPLQSHGSRHDLDTKVSVARSLASLLGMDYAGDFCPGERPAGSLYFVPSHTLSPKDDIAAMGIRGTEDFFGGYVPYPFIANKTITHPLVRRDAQAPPGWSHEHADCISAVVLPGRSVFTAADARLAATELLALGRVRLKDAEGVGGAGQSVIDSPAGLEAHLSRIDPQLLERSGLVLEQNLNRVTTCSVGQVKVGAWLASYHGTQQMTHNGRGHEVYGGSALTVVPGSLDELLGLAPSEGFRKAIEQSITYHDAAFRYFPQMIASRCNYDIVQGVDDQGRWHSGVLEQSWRIGGASGAEIAALQVFRDDPSVRSVRASTVEVYGGAAAVPKRAHILFDGVDQHGDRLTKYVEAEAHVDV